MDDFRKVKLGLKQFMKCFLNKIHIILSITYVVHDMSITAIFELISFKDGPKTKTKQLKKNKNKTLSIVVIFINQNNPVIFVNFINFVTDLVFKVGLKLTVLPSKTLHPSKTHSLLSILLLIFLKLLEQRVFYFHIKNIKKIIINVSSLGVFLDRICPYILKIRSVISQKTPKRRLYRESVKSNSSDLETMYADCFHTPFLFHVTSSVVTDVWGFPQDYDGDTNEMIATQKGRKGQKRLNEERKDPVLTPVEIVGIGTSSGTVRLPHLPRHDRKTLQSLQKEMLTAFKHLQNEEDEEDQQELFAETFFAEVLILSYFSNHFSCFLVTNSVFDKLFKTKSKFKCLQDSGSFACTFSFLCLSVAQSYVCNFMVCSYFTLKGYIYTSGVKTSMPFLLVFCLFRRIGDVNSMLLYSEIQTRSYTRTHIQFSKDYQYNQYKFTLFMRMTSQKSHTGTMQIPIDSYVKVKLCGMAVCEGYTSNNTDNAYDKVDKVYEKSKLNASFNMDRHCDRCSPGYTHNGWSLIRLRGGDIETHPGPTQLKGDFHLLTQNCRGLNNINKLKQIMKVKSELVKTSNFILALQETYLTEETMLQYYGTYAFTKAESMHSAGCVTFFHETVRIIEKHDIDDRGHGHLVVVEGIGNKTVIVGNIYSPVRGLAMEQDAFYEKLSKLIEEIETKYIFHEPDLILLGDFNLPFETRMNRTVAEKLRARDLSEYFISLGLTDCWKGSDNRTTFRNGLSRLDRILFRINGDYSEDLKTDWTFTSSDHCLLYLTLRNNYKHKSRRVTSLPTYILNSKTDLEDITKSLTEYSSMMKEQWSAGMKLEYLKMGLRTVVGERIKYRNKKEREELENIQKTLEEKMISGRVISLRAMEEDREIIDAMFTKRNYILESRSEALAVKAKTKWFHEGEKSNKYFLNILRRRGNLTEIGALDTNDGIITEDDKIKTEIRNFYRELYETEDAVYIDDSYFQHIEKIQPLVASSLTEKITKAELFNTLKSCSDSAPGPDGIPYSYYKVFWNFFGDILVQAWNESLESGLLPQSHRSSLLRLLPKQGKDLTKITNWRPITLSNCDHKLITKCYANRLTKIIQTVIHPNQTAYLPGKQIQDNLRTINIINMQAENPIIVALDAKKAFDSVSHEYIKRTLVERGLGDFVPIFNLLYKDQKVDIAINGDVVEGYTIKKGVKQGDALSCILFIMCIDPLLWNIENNDNIGRVEINGYIAPKILAYADDVTCFADSKISLKRVFKEYERLSKASGLILNADKTEILDKFQREYKVKYMNEVYRVRGLDEVKINGIIFNNNQILMKEKNYEMIVDKITNSLSGWTNRHLSLLGRILIYKTFGLSQIIYVLTVIEFEEMQYRDIEKMFYNYIWRKDFGRTRMYNRISKQKLSLPIEMGGFGMLNLSEVIEGIRCRQLGKMYNTQYNHPLKRCIINEDKSFVSGLALANTVDGVGVRAHEALLEYCNKNINKLSNEQLISDNLAIQQLGEVETIHMFKESKRNSIEAVEIIHRWDCDTLKDIVVKGQLHRTIVGLCRKILKAKYLRIVKKLIQNRTVFTPGKVDKIQLLKGNYKNIYSVTSKEFRTILKGKVTPAPSRIGGNLDDYSVKEYLSQIKRLTSTKHKNTLLRIWNGDCLSYSRLFHFGLVDTDKCPVCNNYDTPEHMLFECVKAKRVWEMLQNKIPKRDSCDLRHYAIGINDSKMQLMVKAEFLKYIMHYRNLDAEVIYRKAVTYLKIVNKNNPIIQNL